MPKDPRVPLNHRCAGWRQIQLDVELAKPLCGNRGGSVHQQILRLLFIGKATTSRMFGVSAAASRCGRYRAPSRMWRRSVFEGVEHTGEAGSASSAE